MIKFVFLILLSGCAKVDLSDYCYSDYECYFYDPYLKEYVPMTKEGLKIKKMRKRLYKEKYLK